MGQVVLLLHINVIPVPRAIYTGYTQHVEFSEKYESNAEPTLNNEHWSGYGKQCTPESP